jgi:hypothetical protein
VFRPPFLANFQPLMSLQQRIVALMPADHPWRHARRRLSDCIGYPVALAEPASADVSCSEVLARSNLRFDIVASRTARFLRHGAARQSDLVPIEIGAVERGCRAADRRPRPAACGSGAGSIARAVLPVPSAKFAGNWQGY